VIHCLFNTTTLLTEVTLCNHTVLLVFQITRTDFLNEIPVQIPHLDRIKSNRIVPLAEQKNI
jgi:hypothetical protein